MLTVFRRHEKACDHRDEGRSYRRCRCTIWVDGIVGGLEIRKSLHIRDWEKAQGIVRRWEDEGQQTTEPIEPEPITLAQAWRSFLADAEARNLQHSTIRKFDLLSRQMQEFVTRCGLRFITQIDLAILRAFRGEWKDGPLSSIKKLERLRAFYRFAQESKWVDDALARKLKAPKAAHRPTLPYSREGMLQILSATTRNIESVQGHGKDNAIRLRALVLLLRYSGLRIGDAVGCPVVRLSDGKIRLYTHKTGTHVHCPLPNFVVREITNIPTMSEQYWFWTGNGKLQTAVTDWQGRLHKLFTDAKIRDGHAHRFRDTFAAELLLSGVPIERVAILLGHQSVRITERHYSPWIRERQEQAEADVRRSWALDPVALLEAKGTPKVRGALETVN